MTAWHLSLNIQSHLFFANYFWVLFFLGQEWGLGGETFFLGPCFLKPSVFTFPGGGGTSAVSFSAQKISHSSNLVESYVPCLESNLNSIYVLDFYLLFHYV